MSTHRFFAQAGLSQEAAEHFGPLIVAIADKHSGSITPEQLLEAARYSDDRVVNDHFQWNDRKAAHAWRLNQAAHVLRHVRIEVVINKAKEKSAVIRAFVNVRMARGGESEDDSDRAFIPLETAMNNPVYREQLLEQALQDLRSFQAKYSNLSELASLLDSVDATLAKLEPKPEKKGAV